MRAPVDTIPAPPFPGGLAWINVASLRMDKQLGRPVVVEFWDFLRAHSLRTLPYLRAWHERYAADGLRVVGIHAPGFAASREPEAVRDACARLGVEYPVLVDSDLRAWRDYENQGWPGRYVFDRTLHLHTLHYGQGGYEETERAIQALLGTEREPLDPLRPEDAEGATLVPPTPDEEGAWSGPYEAGAVWAVLEGAGAVRVNGQQRAVTGPVCELLVEHPRHTAGVLDLELGPGVTCAAVQFTPGLA